MRAKSLLLIGGGLFIALLSTMASAEGDKKNINSVIPSAEIQEGEVVHVIKLEDILQGKYSKEKKMPEPEEVVVDNDKNKSVADDKPSDVVKPSKAVKPVEVSKPIDMKKAFAAVMGYSNEAVVQDSAIQQKVSQQKVAKPTSKPAPSEMGPTTGWLYLGKFSQGQWDQKKNQVLGLNGALPIVGQQYSIRVSSNVRQGYPSKKGMPPIVKVLPQDRKIKLLGIHNSGKSGHYWANVQWF